MNFSSVRVCEVTFAGVVIRHERSFSLALMVWCRAMGGERGGQALPRSGGWVCVCVCVYVCVYTVFTSLLESPTEPIKASGLLQQRMTANYSRLSSLSLSLSFSLSLLHSSLPLCQFLAFSVLLFHSLAIMLLSVYLS